MMTPNERRAGSGGNDTITALSPFHVTTYLNNAMPTSDEEMRRVFPEETIKRLQNLKMKYDPDGMFKAGAWDYQANRLD